MGLEHGVDGFGGYGKAGVPRKGQLDLKKGLIAGGGRGQHYAALRWEEEGIFTEFV